jgi:hypothetical protein
MRRWCVNTAVEVVEAIRRIACCRRCKFYKIVSTPSAIAMK